MKIELTETEEPVKCTVIRLLSEEGKLLAEDTFLSAVNRNDRNMLLGCVRQMLHRKGMLLGSELDETALALHSRVEWISDSVCIIEDLLNNSRSKKGGAADRLYFEKVSGAGVPSGLYIQRGLDVMERARF